MTEAVLRKAANDPVAFGYMFLDWHAFPAQAAWLRGSVEAFNWCRSGNRWGKTESIAIKHLWMCAFKRRDLKYPFSDPYVSLNTSLSLDQARLPIDKAWRILHMPAADAFRRAFIRRRVLTPFPRIEFNNGSVWWARSTVRKGAYLEGHDYDYVSNDEGAVDPYLGYILDEVLGFRLLDRGGMLDCVSTGKRGSEFNKRYEAARVSGVAFTFQGDSRDNPHLDQAALGRVIERLDAGLVEERVYGGERPSDGRIPYESIMAAVERGLGLSPREERHRYSTGWDLAKVSNFTVGVTLDITDEPYQLVAWEKFNERTVDWQRAGARTYWDYVYSRIRLRHRQYGGLTGVDATGLGAVVGDEVADLGAEAVVFTGQRKLELVSTLELGFGLGVIGVPLLSMALPDGTRWTLVDELEEVGDELAGLDTATALALALWPLRAQLRRRTIVPLSPRVVGVAR